MAELRLATNPLEIFDAVVRTELGQDAVFTARIRASVRRWQPVDHPDEFASLDQLAGLPFVAVHQAAMEVIRDDGIDDFTNERWLQVARKLAADWIEARREFEIERERRRADADITAPRPKLCERCGKALAVVCKCDDLGRPASPKIQVRDVPSNRPSMRYDSDKRRS
jgi:hypothetical protein